MARLHHCRPGNTYSSVNSTPPRIERRETIWQHWRESMDSLLTEPPSRSGRPPEPRTSVGVRDDHDDEYTMAQALGRRGHRGGDGRLGGGGAGRTNRPGRA